MDQQISAQDIRQGNFFFKGKDYCRISKVNAKAEFKGIPITPQLLQKCGCIMIDEDDNIVGGDAEDVTKKKVLRLQIKGGNTLVFYPEKNELMINWGVRITNFKFLHQLQNIVYDISGQELTVNL